jgi:hypothetical protein
MLGELGKGISIGTKSITGHANKPSRLVHDLAQGKELAAFLDSEAGFQGKGWDSVLNYAAPLLQSLPDTVVEGAEEPMEDSVAPLPEDDAMQTDEKPKIVSKKVDPLDIGTLTI